MGQKNTENVVKLFSLRNFHLQNKAPVTNLLSFWRKCGFKTRKFGFKMINVVGEQGISSSKLSRVKVAFFANKSDYHFCHTNGFFGVYFSGLAFIVKSFVMQPQIQEKQMNRE